MQNIDSHYEHYNSLINEIGTEKIRERYEFLLQEMTDFIKRVGNDSFVQVNEKLLLHCVLEYFEDISKVKGAHQIEHVNSIKAYAYMSYWILQRRPIQVINHDEMSENEVFLNEKFVLSFIIGFLLGDNKTKPLIGDNLKKYNAYVNTFYYYLKFRQVTAQSLEMIMLSFETGKIFN